MSKISKALAFLAANPGATPYAAAKHAGMTPASLYVRLKKDKARLEEVTRCQSCGRSA